MFLQTLVSFLIYSALIVSAYLSYDRGDTFASWVIVSIGVLNVVYDIQSGLIRRGY